MPPTNLEREVKLAAPETFSLARLDAQLDAYHASPVAFHRLHTVYYDSDDLRLTRWGCSLRYRRGEGWTLKLPRPPGGIGLTREEHVFEGDEREVPAAALALATPYLRGAAPHRVAELRTLRASRRLSDGDGAALAQVVEDDVRVVEGSRVIQRFRQIEIELQDGAGDEALEALAAALRRQGAGTPDPTPKNVIALGRRAAEPELRLARIDRSASAGALVRAALAAQVDKFVRLDSVLRLERDADAVHDARVAIRRMRTYLRTFLPLLERDWACGLRERVRWIADVLGDARDADVLIARLTRSSEALADTDRRRIDRVLAPLRAARAVAYERVGAMLSEPRYAALVDELIDAAKNPRLSERGGCDAAEVGLTLLRAAWKPLRNAHRARATPPADRELHRIRVKAKALRYAAEALVPIGGSRLSRLARRAEALQNVLGEQHDAVVACERLRTAAGEPQRAFLAGELVALESLAAQRARAAWTGCWRAMKRERKRACRRLRAIGGGESG